MMKAVANRVSPENTKRSCKRSDYLGLMPASKMIQQSNQADIKATVKHRFAE
jgi:hypothetical protein